MSNNFLYFVFKIINTAITVATAIEMSINTITTPTAIPTALELLCVSLSGDVEGSDDDSTDTDDDSTDTDDDSTDTDVV